MAFLGPQHRDLLERVRKVAYGTTFTDVRTDLLTLVDWLREADERLLDVERKLFRPGVYRCAKCGFRLISSTLNAADGTITARDAAEHCPNDGAPMWRVTWEEECNGAERLLAETAWSYDFSDAPRDGREIILVLRDREKHWTRHGLDSPVAAMWWDEVERGWSTGGCSRFEDALFSCWRLLP